MKEMFAYSNKCKADIEQEDKITPTLINWWVSANGTTVEYVKTSIGQVYFKGTVNGGTVGQIVFSLPDGYRVLQDAVFKIGSAVATVSASLNALVITESNQNVPLDIISYLAEA
jgi:hypothetical protein